MRERRERFSIGGETGRRAAGCHHVVATGSKPTPNKAAWCLLIDKKTVSKGQKPLVTSHITEGHHKWSVMCTGREPALQSSMENITGCQMGGISQIGWYTPPVWYHRGVKTNTKNCLQALFVFDWVQEYYQHVSGRSESGRRHSSWIIKCVLQNHGEGLNCCSFFFFLQIKIRLLF